MLIAIAFAHFSSELLLKEQMIIPVKKTKLNNAGHIDAKKNPAKSAVFYWLFLGEVSPRNFPWNRPIFLRICPWNSFENGLFSAKIPRNRLIVPLILTFFTRKSREIGQFFREFRLFPRENPAISADFPRICLWKSRKILLFFPRNIRSPATHNIKYSYLKQFFSRQKAKVFHGNVTLLGTLHYSQT